MTIYHIHHIVPRHTGGTDDVENLVKVTIPEHAAFHYERWVLTGSAYDRIAWLALSAQIKGIEASIMAMSLGGKSPRCHTKEAVEKSKLTHIQRYGVSCIFSLPENIRKRDEAILSKYGVRNPSQVPEINLRRKQTFKQNKHQQGSKNSQFNTMWITNGIESRKIGKLETIPEGYRKGRIINRAGFEPT
jgi:hypothetical protein